MPRYIDAEGLSLKVKRYSMPDFNGDGTISFENAERWFLNLIDTTATADVKEKVYAQWVVENETSIRCSNCCFNRCDVLRCVPAAATYLPW